MAELDIRMSDINDLSDVIRMLDVSQLEISRLLEVIHMSSYACIYVCLNAVCTSLIITITMFGLTKPHQQDLVCKQDVRQCCITRAMHVWRPMLLKQTRSALPTEVVVLQTRY